MQGTVLHVFIPYAYNFFIFVTDQLHMYVSLGKGTFTWKSIKHGPDGPSLQMPLSSEVATL